MTTSAAVVCSPVNCPDPASANAQVALQAGVSRRYGKIRTEDVKIGQIAGPINLPDGCTICPSLVHLWESSKPYTTGGRQQWPLASIRSRVTTVASMHALLSTGSKGNRVLWRSVRGHRTLAVPWA